MLTPNPIIYYGSIPNKKPISINGIDVYMVNPNRGNYYGLNQEQKAEHDNSRKLGEKRIKKVADTKAALML